MYKYERVWKEDREKARLQQEAKHDVRHDFVCQISSPTDHTNIIHDSLPSLQ